jgi:4-diphosphocytidyl-2-C-methyl-D-erythritol kinase
VPYFFEGGTVLGLERGDLLFPLIDYPDAWVVVALPPFGVSTKDAFEWWDGIAGGRALKASRFRSVPRAARELGNDLAGPVGAHYPQITRLISAMGRAGATHAGMSGSGSAVFGLFDRRKDAVRATGSLGSFGAGRGIVTMLTRTINRTRYRTLAAA